MQIDMVKTDDLIPYVNNSRTHSDEQVTQIASSIKEFGFTNPILTDGEGGIIAGHGRLMAAKKLGLAEVPTIALEGLTEAQKKAYVIADNQLATNAGWDLDALKTEVERLTELDFDLELLGFDDDFLAGLLEEEPQEGLTDEDDVPEIPEEPVTREGDVWILGNHRLMCGDSTSIDAVERLMNGQIADLLHADPPYGMGKEGDGVANDNLYNEKLDQFQMEWWSTFRIFIADNASAYIWGNAPELWRLWYRGGLGDSERLTLRNEIVWDKKNAQGMGSGGFRMYPTSTERALFFMLGQQGFSKNADNYWNGWESIRAYLKSELAKVGDIKWAKRAAGHSEKSGCHWFDASQWTMPTEVVYKSWQKEAKGNAFKREYEELKREYEATLAYFDNSHENMTEVWGFKRVQGQDRHGHATPKPVEMMERIMRSSLPKNGLCVEPFGGSGSTIMGAEKTGRRCYTMELQATYCDVIIKRWQDFTGKEAVHENGHTFNSLSKNIDIDEVA
jgi:DNA modification methylase